MKKQRLKKLFDDAMAVLQEHEPPEGYFVAFSGGKDSIVILDLVRRSGCKHETHFHKTSIDPPELLSFIKTHYPDVIWDKPEQTMFQLIVRWHMLPTRSRRYCCSVLKENHGYNRIVVTGLRKAESAKRSNRKMFETDKIKSHNKRFINIIIEWSDKDVWDYIHSLNLVYPSLYDEGWKRIGCIGCPMANRKQQFSRYPNVYKAYRNSIEKSMQTHPDKYFGANADLYMEWWMSNLSPESFLETKKQMTINL